MIKTTFFVLTIYESVNKILEISKQFSAIEAWTKDYIPYDAALMNFIIIGEMAGKLRNEFKAQNAGIDWNKIQGFRNIVAHDYFGIDDKVVWQITQTKLPELKEFLSKYLNL
ncbi:MAG: DUF86 domain-containing protein [Bacteroidales bacterium]|nr:DUF86 domain-containing protein [Bacteroidales bacterium]